MNAIAGMKFKLTYFVAAVQHFYIIRPWGFPKDLFLKSWAAISYNLQRSDIIKRSVILAVKIHNLDISLWQEV